MKMRAILVIIAIDTCLIINFSIANEDTCHDLTFTETSDQEKVQAKIYEQLRTWKSAMYNFFKVTTRGSSLKQDETSVNLCKCVLTKKVPNHQSYNNFPYAYAEVTEINANLAGKVKNGIKAIKCIDSNTNSEYIIIKSNIAGYFFKKAYNMYVIREGDKQDEYIYDGVLENAPISAFEPEDVRTGCFCVCGKNNIPRIQIPKIPSIRIPRLRIPPPSIPPLRIPPPMIPIPKIPEVQVKVS